MLNVKMKELLTILILIMSLSAGGTHWLTYYVYYETEYMQGPWTRTDLLKESGYKFLASEAFEDLFGSEDKELVNQMLHRLKNKKPEIYNWNYDITFQGDTVILKTKEKIEKIETVKNEITATLTLNNFKAVTFHFTDQQETWTINDLTLPYLDLVTGRSKTHEPSEKPGRIDAKAQVDKVQTNGAPDKERDSTPWLVISGILNIGLIGLLIMKRKK